MVAELAVVLSRDESIGRACAEALAAADATRSVALVADAAGVVSLDEPVGVLVAVPHHPVPGPSVGHDPAAFFAEVRTAVHHVLPSMVVAGAGRIVLVVTATGLPGQSWSDGTGEAMWAAVGLARTAAREVAARGVTVNVVRTGLVEDDEVRQARDADPEVASALQAVAALAPLRRPIVPADVGAAVAYLASPAAGYVTGIVLPVDGGLSIGQGA